MEKARELQKNIYFCWLIDYAKAFDCVSQSVSSVAQSCPTLCDPMCGSQQSVQKFLKRWEYQTTLPAFWEIYMQVKKQQLESDMKQQTGSKLGKGYVKAV